MADFPGLQLDPDGGALPVNQPGRTASVHANSIPAPFEKVLLSDVIAGGSTVGSPASPAAVDAAGFCLESVAADWLDRIHVLPRRIDYGNILGTVVKIIDVFSAFRDQDVSFTSFVDNVGAGLDITDLPGLPVTITPFDGLSLTLEVTTDGVSQFDTTLDFVFDVGTVLLPVTGARVIMFPYVPETPMEEVLDFKTEVFLFKDGTEKRLALRKNPRQSFTLELARAEGTERSRVDSLLYDWQSRIFGLPMWHESLTINAAIAINDTTIFVASTDFADLRVGGIALILNPDEVTFDALEVSSFDATSITFSSGVQNTYEPSTLVYPTRNAIATSVVTGTRRAVGLSTFKIRFRVTENDPPVSIASTAAFSTFNSKVFLDDFNVIGAQLTESYERDLIEFDGGVGLIGHDSSWTRNKRKSRKAFETRSRQELWEVRQLLHALRGKQISFYIPSFSKELVVADTLANGGDTMTIENVGYARFVQNRSPRDIIRLTKTDGTVLIRTVINSAEIDKNSETLTLDTTWPAIITVGEIAAVDFIEKVRIDSDKISITHLSGLGEASIPFPVKSVFE